MRCALVLIVVAGLLAPATAAAAGRVDRLPAVRGKLWTSGTDLVWESPRHFVRVADARRRVRLKIGIDKTCWVESVSISSLALIACSGYSAEVNDALVFDTRTGTITHEPVPGAPLDVGRHWLLSIYDPDQCYHCDYFVYTNRQTGEQRTGDSYEDPGNLDAPDLRWGPRVRARDHALWLSGERVARCHPRCIAVVLYRGRLAYFDHGRLIQRTLRSGRVRRWPLTRAMESGRVMPVGSNLVVARGSFSRRWRLWRAVPY